MPPKTRYTSENVTKAALTVVEELGLRELTARNVASKLGSSTAPVYQHFSSMEELALDVMRETKKMLLDYASRPYTDRVFLNMGTGVALFACEHSQLYRALLLEGDAYGGVVAEILKALEIKLVEDTRFSVLSDGERRVLLDKMWTFTHGLASMICVGIVKECSQEYIVKTLMDVGADVIGATLAKHKNNIHNQNKPRT